MASEDEINDEGPIDNMGLSLTKSPLERRNTVARRSQRKSIHHIRSKTDLILKDIKRFKGTEEDEEYNTLTERIESLQRELELKKRDLQPQVRKTFDDVHRKVEECFDCLAVKVEDNRKKLEAQKQKDEERKAQEQKNLEEKALQEKTVEDKAIDEDYIVEEVPEGSVQPGSPNNVEYNKQKRKSLQLNLVQIQATVEQYEQPSSPPNSETKRKSIMKMGVPVMPGSIMEALNRKTSIQHRHEKHLADIRKTLENLEYEISQFVGRRNGKYYNKLKEQLDNCSKELDSMKTEDESIKDQISRLQNYVATCVSFLNEKAVDIDEIDNDDVFESDDETSKIEDEVRHNGGGSELKKSFKITSI